MAIDPIRAAGIARHHGLTLPDARAIAAMADSEDEAHRLAAAFAPTDPPTAADDFAAWVDHQLNASPAQRLGIEEDQ